MHDATYSPEDNKLRLYPEGRLDEDEYKRVKAAGFKWAPRQELFVAPMWTPGRTDLLVEMCGEIGDEDTTLVDRAEERAERFEGYSANRKRDADQAHAAVSAITDNIPLGQPILVGHHSEKHARRDAEKIERGMRRAVKMWETSSYWRSRAAGALRHAKYKEIPSMRHRRIKRIEADKRKQERYLAKARQAIELLSSESASDDRLTAFFNCDCHISRCFPLKDYPREPPASQYEGDRSLWSAIKEGIITPRQAANMALEAYRPAVPHHKRWIQHYEFRIEYERAMLGEQTGVADPGEKWAHVKPGARVLIRETWYTVARLNKSLGKASSITTTERRKFGIEKIEEYREPTEADAATVKAATKKPPLCNYRSEDSIDVTAADWKRRWSDGKGVKTIEATETHAVHRRRYFWGTFGGHYTRKWVYITDQKRKDPPPVPLLDPEPPKPKPPQVDAPRLLAAREKARTLFPELEDDPEAAPFEAMRDSLEGGGVKVVSAPQLFVTPEPVAGRMVELADLEPGQRVLEPSAGTGNLIEAVRRASAAAAVTAVEINQQLADGLRSRYDIPVRSADFLACNGDLGQFDRVLMNPPFTGGADIDHVQYAYGYLKPGGVLVSVVCEGPFFREDKKSKAFREWLDLVGAEVERLPDESFKVSGTNVRARLVRISR